MHKKIISVLSLILLLGVFLFLSNAVSQTSTPVESQLTAQELEKEIAKKDMKIPALEAIGIAEKESGGRAVTFRVRRLKDGKLGYSIVVLKENPATLQLIVVHGTTGAILRSLLIETFPMLWFRES